MNPFDDLPKRDRNHTIEEMAETAFRACLVESGTFILQSADQLGQRDRELRRGGCASWVNRPTVSPRGGKYGQCSGRRNSRN